MAALVEPNMCNPDPTSFHPASSKIPEDVFLCDRDESLRELVAAGEISTKDAMEIMNMTSNDITSDSITSDSETIKWNTGSIRGHFGNQYDGILDDEMKRNRKADSIIHFDEGFDETTRWCIRDTITGDIVNHGNLCDPELERKPLTGLERVRNMVSDWVGDIDFAPEEVYA
jgi:hypothetical protein